MIALASVRWQRAPRHVSTWPGGGHNESLTSSPNGPPLVQAAETREANGYGLVEAFKREESIGKNLTRVAQRALLALLVEDPEGGEVFVGCATRLGNARSVCIINKVLTNDNACQL